MKIRVMSDLHLDFHRDLGESFVDSVSPGDILVVAGDVMNTFLLDKNSRRLILEYMSLLDNKFNYSMIIPGNHDYYGAEVSNTSNSVLRDMYSEIGFAWLSRMGSVLIDRVEFFGRTLWTSASNPLFFMNRYNISDYSHISNFMSTGETNSADREALEHRMKSCDYTYKKVIVTHHLPSRKCVSQRFEGDDMNCYFVDDILDSLENSSNNPDLWIHGHGQELFDGEINGVRVVRNPLGYPGENSGFRENFDIEL